MIITFFHRNISLIIVGKKYGFTFLKVLKFVKFVKKGGFCSLAKPVFYSIKSVFLSKSLVQVVVIVVM